MRHVDPAALDATHSLRRLPANRRRSRRRTLPAALLATLETAGGQAPALVISAGSDGIGVLAGQALEPGTALTIKLDAALGLVLAAQVAHCTPQAAGEWYLGCACEDREAVARLLGREPAPDGTATP